MVSLLVIRWIAVIPLLTLVVFSAHTDFLQQHQRLASVYGLVQGQLLVETLPMLVVHWLVAGLHGKRAMVVWCAGFVFYPAVTLLMQSVSVSYQQWQQLNLLLWLLLCVASLSTLLLLGKHTRNKTSSGRWLGWLSLDNMVAVLAIGWALLVAAVLASHDNPMLNQPIDPVIDVAKINAQLGLFIHYLWQLLIYALAIILVYLFNRYVLIRQLLSRFGIVVFISAGLLFILVTTPLLVGLFISLPLNDLPAYVANLTAGGDRNLFNMYNYHMMALFLVLTTPVILAYERQQSDALRLEAKQQQTRTELKLLQQQINPHFLFNTLNSLYALTLAKSDQAAPSVLRLSDMLRYSVYQGQRSQVGLTQELQYLQDYIALQQLRLGSRCEFKLSWPNSDNGLMISPMLLIVPLENAVKHGAEPSSKPTFIDFAVSIDGTTLTLQCVNPLVSEQGVQVHPGGLGLANLQRRLALQYAGRHQLISEQRGDNWHTVLTLELQPNKHKD